MLLSQEPVNNSNTVADSPKKSKRMLSLVILKNSKKMAKLNSTTQQWLSTGMENSLWTTGNHFCIFVINYGANEEMGSNR